LEPSKDRFDLGSYTSLPILALVKGIDVSVIGFGTSTYTLVYHSNDTMTITVRTAHTPTRAFIGAPNILAQELLR
jgi:predicted P-loop ATPase/GTPase